jgi:RNA polymerase sigma-70 factor (ECF subfamily)
MPQDWIDEAVVQRAQEGDLGAFDIMASLIRSGLHRVAVEVLNDPSFAEDLVQETLLAAYKNLDQLDDPALFQPWIMAILRRRAWRWNQETRPQPQELNELDRLLMRRSRELARGHEARQDVQAIIDSLRPEDQDLIHMVAVEGMSAQEMSDATGLPESTIKWRLHEARRRARTALEEEQ